MTKDEKNKNSSRRNFLKSGLTLGAGAVVGGSLLTSCSSANANEITDENSTETIKLLTTDGKVVEGRKSRTCIEIGAALPVCGPSVIVRVKRVGYFPCPLHDKTQRVNRLILRFTAK